MQHLLRRRPQAGASRSSSPWPWTPTPTSKRPPTLIRTSTFTRSFRRPPGSGDVDSGSVMQGAWPHMT
eukprot:1425942-Alexandrium_andersonii.AAC.1